MSQNWRFILKIDNSGCLEISENENMWLSLAYYLCAAGGTWALQGVWLCLSAMKGFYIFEHKVYGNRP